MNWIALGWWLIGGACIVVGIVQAVIVMKGPPERRGRVIVGIVLVVLGAICAVMPLFGDGGVAPGPKETTPDDTPVSLEDMDLTLLLAEAAREGSRLEPAHVELISRLARLTDEELGQVIGWCVTGGPRSVPPSDHWRERYGSVVEALYVTVPVEHMDDTWIDRLLELPVMCSLVYRRTWPAGAAPFIVVQMDHWWPPEFSAVAELVPRSSEILLRPAGVGSWRVEMTGREVDESVGLVVKRIHRHGDEPETIVLQDTARVALIVEGELDDVLPAVRSEAMDAVVRDRLRIELADTALRLDPGAMRTSLFDRVAFGATLELSIGDEPIGAVPARWSVGTDAPGETVWVPLPNSIVGLLSDAPADSLRVRVRSNDDLALQAVNADRRWVGDVTVRVTGTETVAGG